MRIALFYHSLLSDWNHGNAHFLRGVVSELLARGHEVRVYEPRSSWSLANLVAEHGERPLREFRSAYPGLESTRYDLESLDLERELEGFELIIAHEWNDHELVRRLGRYRRRHHACRLLFHDTHHRSVTDPAVMAAYELTEFDGVLAFGEVIRLLYLERGWARSAWTWHEAADTRVFRPLRAARQGDLVWIGNWGDGERAAELREFLLEPCAALGLKARVYGVRYPAEALAALRAAGIEYGGWLPNYKAPRVFARYHVTIHVPRRPYVQALPGIPTIRVFEALACGVPLVCAPWDDAEGLFAPGKDYLVAQSGGQMREHLRRLLADPAAARALAACGRATLLARHTCAHRVDELMLICRQLGLAAAAAPSTATLAGAAGTPAPTPERITG